MNLSTSNFSKTKLLFLGAFLFLSGFLKAQNELVTAVSLLENNRISKLQKMMSPKAKEVLSKKKLSQIWKQIQSQVGEYDSLGTVEVRQNDELEQQEALLYFKKSLLKLQISVNDKKEIDGIFFSPLGYNTPVYGQNLALGKKYYTLQTDTFKLDAELVILTSCNACPVVVLVHGSGPNDKDETIFGNKVFQDLALGLAAKGIATFRYDKRSKVYPNSLKSEFTINDETVFDAISAYHLLKNDTAMPFGNIFILGHSLGAYALPLIADSLKNLKGGIIFSSPSRTLQELIKYQAEYLVSLDNKLTPMEKKIINKTKKIVEDINSERFSKGVKPMLAYWPGSFFRHLKDYNPVEMVNNNPQTPFFVMQGEKDFQITMEDFEGWTKDKQAHVTYKSYPNLTHLFTPSSAPKPSSVDYFTPGNVSEYVIDDIAKWIFDVDNQ